MKRKTILTLLILLFSSYLYSEIIYLNNGEVINGEITNETDQHIIVKTKNKRYKIINSRITRILYGQREMEKIYIILKDDSLVEGFLIDQDSEKVIIRKEQLSNLETTYYKKDIKRFTATKIMSSTPGIRFKAGYIFPLNSGHAKLLPTAIYSAEFSFNFNRFKKTRLSTEISYTNFKSSKDSDISMKIVPLIFSLSYPITFNNFTIAPKLGTGVSMINFKGRSDTQTSGYNFTTKIELGVLYNLISDSLYIGIWGNYFAIYENSERLCSIAAQGSISFRF